MEQTVQRERKIRIIPATKPVSAPGRASGSKQRVAAYCRVSTDSEEQLTSYTAQKAYYTQKIGENPDWEMAGIFADKGITGTSMKKRTEFKRMIAACKRGRIDLILTKSLSRFARNTVDSLEMVRMLRANGIGVIFEKENINTLTESSEFLITLFSGFAQAESESISKNVIWGIQKSREAGNVPFQYQKLLATGGGLTVSRRSSRRRRRQSSVSSAATWTGAAWARSRRNWRRIMFLPPVESRAGRIRSFTTSWSMKNTLVTPFCKKPIPPTASARQ